MLTRKVTPLPNPLPVGRGEGTMLAILSVGRGEVIHPLLHRMEERD